MINIFIIVLCSFIIAIIGIKRDNREKKDNHGFCGLDYTGCFLIILSFITLSATFINQIQLLHKNTQLIAENQFLHKRIILLTKDTKKSSNKLLLGRNESLKLNDKDISEKLMEIGANTIDTFTIRASGHKLFILEIKGEGSSDLDLFVYDLNGNLIDSDTEKGDKGRVSFSPNWDSDFIVKVKNTGNISNKYIIKKLIE